MYFKKCLSSEYFICTVSVGTNTLAVGASNLEVMGGAKSDNREGDEEDDEGENDREGEGATDNMYVDNVEDIVPQELKELRSRLEYLKNLYDIKGEQVRIDVNLNKLLL